MNRGHDVELYRKAGGINMNKLTDEETRELTTVQGFELSIINDEYVKQLKEKTVETVFIEKNADRLLFTNSCWEIQRVNQFKGGNLILDEVYRLRHIGTGKFLAIDENDRKNLTLINTAASLETLFCFKSEMQTKKAPKYKDEEEDENERYTYLKSGQRVMLMSYIDE